MLDEQLVQRVLEFIWNANITVAVGSVTIDLWFAFLGGLREPPEVLTEAEDVSVDSETWTLETEQCNAGGSLGANAGICEHLVDGLVGA